MTLSENPFENMVGKGESAPFSPFPTMFSTLSKTKIVILANFIFSSPNTFNLDQSRILSFGKELNCHLKILSIWTSVQIFWSSKELSLYQRTN